MAQNVGNFSNSAGEAKLYGALLDQELAHEAQEAAYARKKKRMNCVPMLLTLLLPWSLFLVSFCSAAFWMHYAAPLTSVILNALAVLLCLWYLPGNLRRRKLSPDDGFYPAHLNLALLVAAVLGWAMGDFCFWVYTEPAYTAELMVSYSEVDPSFETLADGRVVPTSGGRFQDAGKVYFKSTVQLDVNMSTSFKLGDLYCVAPIVNPECRDNCGHDFFAIGKNCCSEDGKEFKCGEYDNKHAKSGLRLVETADIAFYRLAVVQLMGKNKIVSQHPIFFQWLMDPVAQIDEWKKSAYRRFLISMFGAWFLNAGVLYFALKAMRSK